MKLFKKDSVFFKRLLWLPIPIEGGMQGWVECWRKEYQNFKWVFWNLSCPLLPFLLSYSDIVLATSFPYLRISWIVCHCWHWERLHLSSALEERKWLWTVVLQVESKILCLLFKVFCWLLKPQYLPKFNLLLLPTLFTTIVCSLIWHHIMLILGWKLLDI